MSRAARKKPVDCGDGTQRRPPQYRWRDIQCRSRCNSLLPTLPLLSTTTLNRSIQHVPLPALSTATLALLWLRCGYCFTQPLGVLRTNTSNLTDLPDSVNDAFRLPMAPHAPWRLPSHAQRIGRRRRRSPERACSSSSLRPSRRTTCPRSPTTISMTKWSASI